MASFVKSAKGGDKLIYEGFIYVKCGNGKDGKRYWRCETWRLLNVLRGDGGVRNPIEFLTACSHYIHF